MSESLVLDILLNARKTLESELQSLRNSLAVKTKTLEALNSTITLIRGRSAEELKLLDKPKVKRQARTIYNDASVKQGIEGYFLSSRKGTPRQIAEYLIKEKRLTNYGPMTRQKLRKIIKTIPGVVKKSAAKNTYYEFEV